MRVVCDLEADGLEPNQIWVIVIKDIDTNETYIFHPFRPEEAKAFSDLARRVVLWVGHNFLNYDLPALNRLVPGCSICWSDVVDTFVVSRTVDATLDGHSLEEWGKRLGKEKKHTGIADWSKFTPDMEERCVSDVEVNFLLYQHFLKYLNSPLWASAFKTEHYIAHLCSVLHHNGFAFDKDGAVQLKKEIDEELLEIETDLRVSFLPEVKLIREVTPRMTKFGTIAKNSIPRVLGTDFTPYTPDAPFSLIEYVTFNPRSHKQRMDRLWDAGWQPVNKTKTHKDTEKARNALKRDRRTRSTRKAEINDLEASLGEYGVSGHGKYGWKTDEDNLATLPPSAPESAQRLARYMLLAPRSSTLQTWLDAYNEGTGRIHGRFHHILPWTHRMSHSEPNMGNVPKWNEKRPETTPYSNRLRALWRAGEGRLLVGVDAESIQLRILAHYINDEQFTRSLIEGKKEDGTDPHSLNQKALGAVCRSRDDAKTFIYAWVLDAGIGQVATILNCSRHEAQEANDNFLKFYPGLKYVKEEVVPKDARQGFFKALDGRFIRIWGEDFDTRKHFTIAGYLQSGEAIIMKRAAQIWYPRLEGENIPFWFVNFVHDEFQIETVDDMEIAEYVAKTIADSIRQVGVDLGLQCPMAGSILNGSGKLAIGKNWLETH